jgi:hypothetical protein
MGWKQSIKKLFLKIFAVLNSIRFNSIRFKTKPNLKTKSATILLGLYSGSIKECQSIKKRDQNPFLLIKHNKTKAANKSSDFNYPTL